MSTLIYKLQKQAVDLLNDVQICSHGLRKTAQEPESLESMGVNLSSGLKALQKSLQEAFTALPDERKIFIPELEAIRQFTADNDLDLVDMLRNFEINSDGLVTSMYFQGRNIKNLEAIANLTSLKDLRLCSNGIYDIQWLSGLKNIEKLELASNNISDISVVVNFPNLLLLSIPGNSIEDLSALRHLKKIDWLEIEYNPILDLSPVANCKSLRGLKLDCSADKDLAPLESLPKLQHLFLYGNEDEISENPIVKRLQARQMNISIDRKN